jgi:hypothetical protein
VPDNESQTISSTQQLFRIGSAVENGNQVDHADSPDALNISRNTVGKVLRSGETRFVRARDSAAAETRPLGRRSRSTAEGECGVERVEGWP